MTKAKPEPKKRASSRRGVRLKNEYRKPHISGWGLDMSDITSWLEAGVTEALTLAMKDENTCLEWPAAWHDGDGFDKRGPIDPLMVYLIIAIGGGLDKDPVYSFNLRDALKDKLESCQTDGSFSEGLANIRDALRTLADEVDAALSHRKSKA